MNKNLKFHNDACLIANDASTKKLDELEQTITKMVAQLFVDSLEPILATRLSDESYRGLVNYAQASITDTPIGKVQKALVS